jgi:hypothetical protein
MRDAPALRAEARSLRHRAREFLDQEVVDQIHALAQELERLAVEVDGRASRGHLLTVI